MSWKKYGGVKSLENMNNITVQNIVTDTFTVRQAFLNLITIDGRLVVTGSTDLQGTLNVEKSVTIHENLIVYGTADISTNTLVAGNLVVINTLTTRNTNVTENLFVQGNIYLDPDKDTYIYGKASKVGINTNNPQATLDISGAFNESINVKTYQTINKNILARNNNNQGIVLLSDASGAYVEFFTETPIPSTNNNVVFNDINYVADASMSYHKGGILELNSKTDLLFSSSVIMSKRTNCGHLLQESAIIYDIPANAYFYNVYNKPNVKTGNALTLVSNDNSSNTFLNIINCNKQGAAFGGGAYPNDLSRNMAIIGVLDISGTLTPHQIIVSGNSTVRTKATVGFNTFAPKTELYSVNINGPLKITNVEITSIVEPIIQVNNIGYSKNTNYRDIINIVGTPYPTGPSTNLYYTWNSNTGGQTWKQQQMSNTTSGLVPTFYGYGSAVYDSNIIIISGQSVLLYSLNGGTTWGTFGQTVNQNFYAVSIIDYSTLQRIFVTYSGYFFYFDVSMNTIIATDYIITPIITNTSITASMVDCDIAGSILYIAGGTTIKTYLVSSPASSLNTWTTTVTLGTYNSISAFSGNHVVAVGNNTITYSNNGGTNWADINLTGKIFNSVFVYDNQNAVAVGNGGIVYYTNNGSTTWQPVPYDLLNASGMADRLLDANYNLSSVYMPNLSSIIISCVIQIYNTPTPGKSKIFYVYAPNLFNITSTTTNTVLDICGNMSLTGSVTMSGQINQF